MVMSSIKWEFLKFCIVDVQRCGKMLKKRFFLILPVLGVVAVVFA